MSESQRRPNRKLFSPREIALIFAIPAAVAGICLAVDIAAGDRVTQGLPRAALLDLLAGIVALVAMSAILPWWTSARLDGWKGIGAVVVGFEVSIVVSAALMALIGLVHEEPCLLQMLRVHAVLLGVGLLVIGLAGALRIVVRKPVAAAFAAMMLVFLALTTPFWGNPLIRAASVENRTRVIDGLIVATPISACSSAVGYSLYRGYRMYDLSIVADYHGAHRLPEWWIYASVTGCAGAVLILLSGWRASCRR